MSAINPKQKNFKKGVALWLFLFICMSMQAQITRYLEYKMPQALTTDQWRALKMIPDDKDLMIYVSDLNMYYLYSGQSWVEVGNGGNIASALRKNQTILGFREAFITNVEASDTLPYQGVPKLKKEQWQLMQLSEEDRGLLIHEGEYKVFTGTQWNKLGKGGNFGRVLNRQGSIEGIKEGFLYTWKRAFGFGLYVGLPYASFFRDEVYPSNPLKKGLSSGWEVGITQNLMYRRFFKSQVYISYSNIALSETFVNSEGSELRADWTFAGPAIAFMPIILTPGTDDTKLTIGAGAYARYNFTTELSTDATLPVVIDTEEDIEPFHYGFRAQIGMQLYRFNIIFSATNQYNNTMSSEVVMFDQDLRNLRMKTYALNLQYNF